MNLLWNNKNMHHMICDSDSGISNHYVQWCNDDDEDDDDDEVLWSVIYQYYIAHISTRACTNTHRYTYIGSLFGGTHII